MHRSASVLAAVVMWGCTLVTGPDAATDPLTVFDAAWREVDRHYSFFDYKHIDWNAVYSRYRPQVESAGSSERLYGVLCGLVGELRSYHAALVTSTSACSWKGPDHPANFDRVIAESAIPGGVTISPGGFFRFGMLAADIGYISIPSFVGEGVEQHVDDVFDALGTMRALVVDIRGNGGGNDLNGYAVAARLTSTGVLYGLARYRNGPAHTDFTQPIEQSLAPAGRHRFSGPVALLTNRANGSAAEDFVTMMRVLPTVFTVGDTTIGNSSNPLTRELPNGWQLTVPQSVQTTPDGFVIESRGLPPTIPVMLDAADASHGVDTILQRAVAELRRRLAGTASAAPSSSPPAASAPTLSPESRWR